MAGFEPVLRVWRNADDLLKEHMTEKLRLLWEKSRCYGNNDVVTQAYGIYHIASM